MGRDSAGRRKASRGEKSEEELKKALEPAKELAFWRTRGISKASGTERERKEKKKRRVEGEEKRGAGTAKRQKATIDGTEYRYTVEGGPTQDGHCS